MKAGAVSQDSEQALDAMDLRGKVKFGMPKLKEQGLTKRM
jgi:hypothetical protein